jgi:hypothetical protein
MRKIFAWQGGVLVSCHSARANRFATTVQDFPAMRWSSYQSLLAQNFISNYGKKAVQTAANNLRMLQAYPAPHVQVPRHILKFTVGKLERLHMLRHLRDNFCVDYYSHTHFPSVSTPLSALRQIHVKIQWSRKSASFADVVFPSDTSKLTTTWQSAVGLSCWTHQNLQLSWDFV